jgi:hypothetical protein
VDRARGFILHQSSRARPASRESAGGADRCFRRRKAGGVVALLDELPSLDEGGRTAYDPPLMILLSACTLQAGYGLSGDGHALLNERTRRRDRPAPGRTIQGASSRPCDARSRGTSRFPPLPQARIDPVGLLAGQSTPSGEPSLFADALVGPSVYRVHRIRWLLDQRIALLRHVEALRLYAAEHDGRLPAKLSEIAVPLPDDPLTGKPFRYEVTGDTAHLRGQAPVVEEKNPEFNVHYEVTLRK